MSLAKYRFLRASLIFSAAICFLAPKKRLQNRLHLPEHMSANALLQALNLLLSREELAEIVREWDNENGETHG